MMCPSKIGQIKEHKMRMKVMKRIKESGKKAPEIQNAIILLVFADKRTQV